MRTAKKIDKKIYFAVQEYLSDLIFIIIAFTIFNKLPYFQDLLQPQAKEIIYWLAIGYVVIGLPYFILRNYIYPNFYLDHKNKSLIVLSFIAMSIPSILKFFIIVPSSKNFMKISIDEKTRVAILSIFLKFYYIPIMLSFLIGNFQDIVRLWHAMPFNLLTFNAFNIWGYYLLLSLILLIDTAIFAFGYIFEAKWLKNEIKSVDPYLSGWLFALICYPPFNNTIDTFLKTGYSVNTIFTAPLLFCFLICALFFYFIYLWATLALWTKASNLTNRGIVSSGPYGFVRHPAYIAKNLAWWLERTPFITTWVGFLSILIWNFIYMMRALTEERHLLSDIKYRKYVKKVRWRFIPGLI